MSTKLGDATKTLKRYVRLADTSATPGSLSTKEINAAKLPKEAKQVLGSICSRAGNSTGGLSVENYDRWIDRFAETFEKLDVDGDLHLSAAELSQADSKPFGIPAGSLKKFDLFVHSLDKAESSEE